MPNSLELVLSGELVNPDGYMRLVRIQEALDGGRWFGDYVSRSDSGAGTLIYWSHLLDGLILLLSVPLALFLTPTDALFWAGALITPIFTGILGALSAWAIAPLVSPAWRWLAALTVVFAVPILNYGQIGMATHHIPILAFVVATWGAGGRSVLDGKYWGLMAGCLASMALWLSPESMPFCMMVFGGLYFSWVIDPRPQIIKSLVQYGSAFFCGISLALLIDPPVGGIFSQALDRLSINFWVLSLIIFIISNLLCWSNKASLMVLGRMCIAALTSTVGAVVWLFIFPDFLLGLKGLMRSHEAAAFFITSEMQSTSTLDLFFAYGSYGILLIGSCLYMFIRTKEQFMKLFWLYISICSLIISVFAFSYVRFSIYSAVASVMLLSIVISTIDKSSFKRYGYLIRPFLIALFLLAPIGLSVGLTSKSKLEAGLARGEQKTRCKLLDVAPYLKSYDAVVVLTSINDGPELLYRSPVKIVGALYHAGIDGYMRLRAAWKTRLLDDIPNELKVASIQYILLCPSSLRSGIVDGEKTTLFDRLNQDNPPSWLIPISLPNLPDWRLYQIK